MRKAGKEIGARAAQTLLEQASCALKMIVASPEIESYAIGVTGNPNTRKQSYRQVATITGFVLLEWNLDAELTEFMERGLYDLIRNADGASDLNSKAVDRIKIGHYTPSINSKFEQIKGSEPFTRAD